MEVRHHLVLFRGAARAWLGVHRGGGAVEEAEEGEVGRARGEGFALSFEGTHRADGNRDVGIGDQGNGDGKEDNQGSGREDDGLSLGCVSAGELEHRGDVTEIVVNDLGPQWGSLKTVLVSKAEPATEAV